MGALERRLRRVDVFDDNDDINDWMARRNAFAATRAEAEGGPLPSWIMDSPLNVSKLEGANRWQQFRHHYKNDLKYRGGKVSGRSGKGSGWSGKRYGWERNGPLTRMIDGLPADAKGLVGGGAVATASLPLHVNYEDPTP